MSGTGLYAPFARTQEEREATGDPRLSIEERYENLNEYLVLVEDAALELMLEGYLRREDLREILLAADSRWDYNMRGAE